MSRFDSLEKTLIRVNQAAIALMMAAMFLLVFGNVIGRYVMQVSIAWAEEISQYLMIWVTYIGAGLALREGRHVAIEVLQDRLPEPVRTGLRAVIAAGLLAFFVAIAYFGFLYARFGMSQQSPAAQIPRGIPYLAIPAGALVFCLHLIGFFRSFVRRAWERPSSSYDEGGLPELDGEPRHQDGERQPR